MAGNITSENKIVHSLAATGYTKLIQTEGCEYITLELVAPSGTPTCDGSWSFCFTNDSSNTSPEAATSPTVTWSTPSAGDTDVVQLKVRGAAFVAAKWTLSSGGTGEEATINVARSRK